MLRYGDPGYMEEDNSPKLYAITFSFLGIALLVVALRFFSRFYLVRVRFITVSEWLILLCVLLDIASCILIHFQIETGMGKHIEYSRERPKMLQLSMKVGLAQNVCYQTLVGLIKISICAQFYFIAPKGPQRKVVLGLTAFVVMFTLFTTFAAIFQCIPMKAAWDLDNFPKGCWNMTNVNFFTSSMNTFLDIVIFVLPFPAMAKLQMERKKKFALVVTYCVGSLAIACSVIRLRNIVHFNGVGDFTYEASMVPIWGAIETNAGIICASFPFIVPLLRWASGSAINTITGSRSGNRTLMTSGTAHEMQRSKSGTRGQSMYLQTSRSKVPTESTENITAETARASVDTDKRSVGQVHREMVPEGAV